MSQLFELRISPEIEEISCMEPAGGWSSNNTFRIKLKCGNCKDDTKFLPLCMEKVTKSPSCNAHIIHKCRCKNVGTVQIVSLLHGHLTKNGHIRIMKLECKKMEPVDVAFDFQWQAYDKNGNLSDEFEFTAGVSPRFNVAQNMTTQQPQVTGLRGYFEVMDG
ncbi:uncharacterized protein LOC142634746 [Castanea sativa]|uniref:uncharacterized protein LOC142634746 n=1 Tax=Castanea sativa TaxID=21020 RepID=UPI003F64E164